MRKSVHINHNLEIPAGELQFKYARSGGKGGQNVNKVETKVELTFNVAGSPNLSDNQRNLIIKNLKNQIDSEGWLHIVSQESRSQWKNRENAIRKFIYQLQRALKPSKKRIKTRKSFVSVETRLRQKKKRSGVKKMRERISDY